MQAKVTGTAIAVPVISAMGPMAAPVMVVAPGVVSVDGHIVTPGMTEKEHKHEYCHVHPEDKNRTIKKTVWKEVPYMAK